MKVIPKYVIDFSFFLPALILIAGCIEVYNPNLTPSGDYLVFDGSITNDTLPLNVYIYHSGAYGSSGKTVVESQAIVEINDDDGNV